MIRGVLNAKVMAAAKRTAKIEEHSPSKTPRRLIKLPRFTSRGKIFYAILALEEGDEEIPLHP